MSLTDIRDEVWPDPLDVKVELAFGADLTLTPDEWVWTDVSHLLKTNDGLTYRRGRPDESRKLNPSHFEFALDNDDGAFTPGNALSPHYPYIRRGVPVRYTLPGNMPDPQQLVVDDFNRTIETGWFIPSGKGVEWSYSPLFVPDSGIVPTASVDGSAGLLTLSGTPNVRVAMLQGTSTVDADYRVTVGINEVPTGTDEQVQTEFYVRTRYQYAIVWRTDGSMTVRLDRADGVPNELGEIVNSLFRERIVDHVDTGLTFTGSETYEVRMQTVGSTHRFKIWETGTSEPGSWLIEHDDGTYKSGMFALGQWTGGDHTNDPLVWSFDDLVITQFATPPVFLGQVAEWAPTWPDGDLGDYARCNVTAGGVLRQQSQREKRASSTMFSTTISYPLARDYWPAEDGPAATQLANAIEGRPPASVSGDVEMSAEAPLTSTEPLPRINSGGVISGEVVSGEDGSQSLVMLLDIPEGGLNNNQTLALIRPRNGFAVTVEYRYLSGGHIEIISTDEDGNVTDFDSTGSTWISLDGQLQAVQFRLGVVAPGSAYSAAIFKRRIQQDGTVLPFGDTAGAFGDDHLLAIINTPPTLAIGQIDSWSIGSSGLGDGVVIGHIVYSGGPGLDSFYQELFPYRNPGVSGFLGESAVERFARLTNDANIPAVVNGSVNESALMGPQPPGNVIDLLQNCVNLDGGIMSETTELIGLRYDALHTLYSQEPAVTLDASAEPLREIKNPFHPVLNDFDIVNDVTVSREGGSSARAVDQQSVAQEGRYDEQVTLNAYNDAQLSDLASWRLHLGTWPGMRYPQLSPDLGAVPSLIRTWVGLKLGDRVRVINLPPQHPEGAVDLLVQGTNDRLTPMGWSAVGNMSPEGPYHIGEVADPDDIGTGETFSRLGSDGSWTVAGMRTDGTTGDFATTPDAPIFDAMQLVRLRVDVTLETYRSGVNEYLFGKYDFDADQRSFIMRIEQDGFFQCLLSSNGTGFEVADSGVLIPATAGQRIALQAIISVDGGSGDFVVTFWTAPTIAGTFQQIGEGTGTLPGTSLFNSTAPVAVGAAGDGGNGPPGVYHGADLQVGGVTVANPDFEHLPAGTTNFQDDAGNPWTINGSAQVIDQFRAGVDTVLVVSSRSQPWIYNADFASDFPFNITASGVELEVTAVDVNGQIQEMTVTQQPVNGIEKIIPPGSEVQVANPVYIGL